MRLGGRKLMVDGIAQQDFNVVKDLQEGSTGLRVPVVEPNCPDVIPFAGIEEIPKPGLAEVHHRIAMEDGGEEYAIDNLVSACKPCHSRETMRERRERARIGG